MISWLRGHDLYYFVPKMSPSLISAAQKLARECVKKNYKGC